MADFFDYLDWYGDFDFATVPFNEVDNIILSQLAYLRLAGALGADEVLPVAEAQERFLAAHRVDATDPDGKEATKEDLPDNGPLIDKSTNLVLGRLASCGRRFRDARVGFYESVFSEEEREQFAAITVLLPDGSVYVAYRGTDDSVVGWIEDCEISYKVVPAQRDALAYLRRVARATIGPLRVGGHSKGGNLAAYAAVAAPELDARIEEVWCNDSPGFVDEVVPLAGFERLRSRMRVFTPEYSVVGALMTHPVEKRIIESAGRGVMAHSLVQWQVMRDHIVPGDALHPGSVEVSHAFERLLHGFDLAGREHFVDELWRVCQENGIRTIDIAKQGAKLSRLLDSIDSVTDENKRALQDFLVAMTGGAIRGEVEESLAKTSQALAPVVAPVAQAVNTALADLDRRGRELLESTRPRELAAATEPDQPHVAEEPPEADED